MWEMYYLKFTLLFFFLFFFVAYLEVVHVFYDVTYCMTFFFFFFCDITNLLFLISWGNLIANASLLVLCCGLVWLKFWTPCVKFIVGMFVELWERGSVCDDCTETGVDVGNIRTWRHFFNEKWCNDMVDVRFKLVF